MTNNTTCFSHVIWMLAATVFSTWATAEDASFDSNWHQWRGPQANGTSNTATPPTRWSETNNVLWKAAMPGRGTSTPIIWNDRVFVLTAVGTGTIDPALPKPEDQPKRVFNITHPNTSYRFLVSCLDRRSGQTVWQRTAKTTVPHEGHHGDNDFASASPVTDGTRLVCWFGSAGLFCYDLDGSLLWQRDLGPAYMGASLGEGCSPVLHDNKIVIVRDQSRQSTIEVIDATDGTTLWKQDRDEPNAWATPRIVHHEGRHQVITAASNYVRSYDLESGDIIWQCDGLTGNVIPCPVTIDENVICMSGYEGYAILSLPLSLTGNVMANDVAAWSTRDGAPYIPSPVLVGSRLFFNQSNQAIFRCLDARTGQVLVERTRLSGLSNVYSSPISADGKVFIMGRNGTTLVIDAQSDLEVIAENELDDRFDASPATVGDQLFLRGAKWLYCLADAQTNDRD